MSKKQQSRAASESALFLLVMGAILVLCNVLGVFFHGRADTTEKELFSLSKGSMRLASSLKDRMEIVGYFSPDLPAPYNAVERYVRDLLTEYKDASHGKITLRFVHPSRDKDEDKQKAEADGVVRVQDQKLEADSFTAVEGYRGLAVKYLGETRAIPHIESTDGLEYQLTQLIKEMSGEKVKIGIVSGHVVQPPQNPMQMQMQPPGNHMNAVKAYLPTYDVQDVDATKEIPKDLKALLIVQPETAFSEQELKYINQYVMNGGSLGVFGGAFKVDAQQGQPQGAPLETGLNKLLSKWGVKLKAGIVADAQCGRANMPTNLGIAIRVPYPPVPILTFQDYQRRHPVLFKLDQIGMPYTSPLGLTDALKGDKSVKTTILAQSTKQSWLMEGESVELKAKDRWAVPEYNGPHAIGLALDGTLPSAFASSAASTPEGGDSGGDVKAPARSTKPVHVLVFGSGYFMRDEFLPEPQPGAHEIPQGGGVAFALNAIDWLAQDSDLVAIRAKNVEDPALEVPSTVKEAENTIREAVQEQDESKAQAAFEKRKAAMATWDQKKTTYRMGNTLGLPIAFALFGVVRWRMRKARRANMKL
jgi:ABC-type uncharacterized transport system involved in gliding motility auxiliary subunit